MIETASIFAEFVHELGDDFVIDAVNDLGVSFYYHNRLDLKFNIVLPPMYGVEDGKIGFAVVKHTIPYLSKQYSFEDPTMLDDITKRISAWIYNG